MKKTSLFDSNAYLQDPEKYRYALIASVYNSTAIETGASVESVSRQIQEISSTNCHAKPTRPESKSR